MIGAVSVGMFGNVSVGIVIAGAHYVSSIALGILMRFYGRKKELSQKIVKVPQKKKNLIRHALEELFAARQKDGRPFGQLLGDSIKDSISTLLQIGGFIILFSVITKILTSIGIASILTRIIMFFLAPFGIAESLVLPIIGGVFEITNGADLAAKAAAPLFQRLMICNAIIAWSGLSVHAQVTTMVQGTDIRIKPYIFARMLHGILATLATFIFLSPTVSVLLPVHLPVIFKESIFTLGFLDRFTFIFNNLFVILVLMVILSLLITLIKRIKVIVFHYHG